MKCLSLIFGLVPALILAQWQPQKLADFPGPARDDAVAAYYNGKIYAGFGLNAFFAYCNDWWVYNIDENSWQELEKSPMQPRQYVRSFIIDQHLYLFGGTDGHQAFGDFWRFNFETQTWTQLESPPFSARWAGVGFSIQGKGYLGLGNNFDSTFQDLWQYSPENETWQRMADFPAVGRSKCVGESMGFKALIAGGLTETDSGFDLHDAIWYYDPILSQWQEGALKLPVASAYHYAAFYGNQTLIWGGFTRKNGQDSILPDQLAYQIPGQISVFNDLKNLPFGRGGNMVSDKKGNFYLLWGLNKDFQRINDLYLLSAVQTESDQDDALLFPNPTINGRVWLSARDAKALQVFDWLGRQKEELALKPLENYHLLDLSSLAAGDYILRLEFTSGETQKLRLRRD